MDSPDDFKGDIRAREGGLYIVAQIIGACLGAVVTDVVFGAVVSIASTARTGPPMWTSEFIASFGLIGAILGAVQIRPNGGACRGWNIYRRRLLVHRLVLHSFASPAATIGRTLSDSYAESLPEAFRRTVIAQLLGAAAAFAVFSWMFGRYQNKLEDLKCWNSRVRIKILVRVIGLGLKSNRVDKV